MKATSDQYNIAVQPNDIMNLIKRDFLISVILLIISASFFCYVNLSIKPFDEWHTLKYSTQDSKTYLDVGRWILGENTFDNVESSVAIRPFFYPLVIVILDSIHPLAVEIFQFILWHIQILMIYYFCIKISKSLIISILISILSISILSPIGISLHALTETLSSFFVTFFVFTLILFLEKNSYRYIYACLSSLSFCSVTRPSYIYVYIFSITIFFIFLIKKRSFLYICVLATTFIPISLQYHVMKKHFDSYKLSFIDSFAINDYFLSGLELYKRKVEFDVNKNLYIRMVRDARRGRMAEIIKEKGYGETSKKVKSDFFANLASYPNESVCQFKNLIIENSMQPSSFITANKILYIATLAQSKILLTINIISALFFSVVTFNKKYFTEEIYKNNILFSLLIFFCIYFTYISTGLTFWQGDRFIIPIYYASIMLFVYQARMLSAFIRNINKK